MFIVLYEVQLMALSSITLLHAGKTEKPDSFDG